MIPASQKRTVMGLSLILLLTSSIPTQARDNDSWTNALGIGAAVAAAGAVCGAAVAGLVYAFSKSDEQVCDDAQRTVRDAHRILKRFYSEYVNVFERAYYGTPGLDEIEKSFLAVVAYRAYYELNLSLDSYINNLKENLNLLEQSLSDVKDRIRNLESKRETYTTIYDRLSSVKRELEDELYRFKPYYQRFADHRAYFAIYAFESKLYAVYAREFELGRQYQYDPYLFERFFIQTARAQNLHRDYPLLQYHSRLNEHIATVERYMRDLKYYYPTRTPEAQQLINYLVHLRGVLTSSSAYIEEKQRKKDDDTRQEIAILQQQLAHEQAMRSVAEAQRNYAQAQLHYRY